MALPRSLSFFYSTFPDRWMPPPFLTRKPSAVDFFLNFFFLGSSDLKRCSPFFFSSEVGQPLVYLRGYFFFFSFFFFLFFFFFFCLDSLVGFRGSCAQLAFPFFSASPFPSFFFPTVIFTRALLALAREDAVISPFRMNSLPSFFLFGIPGLVVWKKMVFGVLNG